MGTWLLVTALGCSVLPETSRTGAVREIKIEEMVSPRELFAAMGDEIRWVNLRSKPVHIGFLGSSPMKAVSCQNGFSSFGVLQDFVTIPPQQSASLCFAKPGTVQFNVWLDTDDLRGNVTRTATIRVLG
ncbi:MAG: hypothetical protein EPO61_13135 [Nitrospirae bacterium]|nr:MAG: hypothetical protein EPO61_13135 [Nitrospirota bacterium]